MSEEFLKHLYDPFSQERSRLGDGTRILLAEDNDINIYVAQIILEKARCADDDYGWY